MAFHCQYVDLILLWIKKYHGLRVHNGWSLNGIETPTQKVDVWYKDADRNMWFKFSTKSQGEIGDLKLSW